MKISQAKALINEALTKLNGFKTTMNADHSYLAVGVKTGQITAAAAAERIMRENSNAFNLAVKQF